MGLNWRNLRSKHSWILGELEFCTQTQILWLEPSSLVKVLLQFPDRERSAKLCQTGHDEGKPPDELFVVAGLLLENLSSAAPCQCPIGRCLERQLRLTELHTLLPTVPYITTINHSLCHFAISIRPEVKHEVTAATPFLSPTWWIICNK